jgi:hypothetical protein
MKHNLILFMLFFALIACKKEKTANIILDEKVDKTLSTEKAKGNFSNGPHGMVSGLAKIYTKGSETQLALENFSSSNGPNLMVYLSKEKDPVNFINLGDLKATGGNQLYNIPQNIKFTDYTYALIYCKAHSKLWGFAQIN